LSTDRESSLLNSISEANSLFHHRSTLPSLFLLAVGRRRRLPTLSILPFDDGSRVALSRGRVLLQVLLLRCLRRFLLLLVMVSVRSVLLRMILDGGSVGLSFDGKLRDRDWRAASRLLVRGFSG